jgi:hypothetical protein
MDRHVLKRVRGRPRLRRAAEAAAEGLRVTVCAAGADLRASGDWVPSRLGPLDGAAVAYALALASSLGREPSSTRMPRDAADASLNGRAPFGHEAKARAHSTFALRSGRPQRLRVRTAACPSLRPG